MGTRLRGTIVLVLVATAVCWPAPAVLAQGNEGADKPAEETPKAEEQPAQAVAEAPALAIALVHLSKVQQEYAELRTQEQDLGKWLQGRRTFLDELGNFAFLSSKDFQDVTAILGKSGALSDEDKKRMAELRDISDAKDKRYRELLATPQRTPQQEEEYNSLHEIYEARQKEIDQLSKQFAGELQTRRQKAISVLMPKVKAAIEAEAKAQNFDFVLDADIVFFGGVDITDSVIARLNAGQPAAEGTQDGGQEGGQ